MPEVKYDPKGQWHYFIEILPSHGKGVVDGIGGRAKSIVRRKVISKNDDVIVQSSLDFTTLVAELMPATSDACVALAS